MLINQKDALRDFLVYKNQCLCVDGSFYAETFKEKMGKPMKSKITSLPVWRQFQGVAVNADPFFVPSVPLVRLYHGGIQHYTDDTAIAIITKIQAQLRDAVRGVIKRIHNWRLFSEVSGLNLCLVASNGVICQGLLKEVLKTIDEPQPGVEKKRLLANDHFRMRFADELVVWCYANPDDAKLNNLSFDCCGDLVISRKRDITVSGGGAWNMD